MTTRMNGDNLVYRFFFVAFANVKKEQKQRYTNVEIREVK